VIEQREEHQSQHQPDTDFVKCVLIQFQAPSPISLFRYFLSFLGTTAPFS
jgi:hypothetical protein